MLAALLAAIAAIVCCAVSCDRSDDDNAAGDGPAARVTTAASPAAEVPVPVAPVPESSFTGSTGEAADLVKALRAAGFGGPVVGGEPLLGLEFSRPAGNAAVNTFAVCGCGEWGDRIYGEEFRKAYQQPPGRHAGAAFDAALLVSISVAASAQFADH